MRKILFRAKRDDDGLWFEGNVRHFKDGVYIEHYIGKGKLNEPVIWETVGQFTGVTDKNGTKIFEHDIVAYDVEEDGLEYVDYAHVVWDEEKLRWKVKWCMGYEDSYLERSDSKEFRVVGNVFDNTELMEKERNWNA